MQGTREWVGCCIQQWACLRRLAREQSERRVWTGSASFHRSGAASEPDLGKDGNTTSLTHTHVHLYALGKVVQPEKKTKKRAIVNYTLLVLLTV